jgi:hypothetical protein
MIGPAIIGKGGTHAKHVRERTGVRIEVERESSDHGDGKTVVGPWGDTLGGTLS